MSLDWGVSRSAASPEVQPPVRETPAPAVPPRRAGRGRRSWLGRILLVLLLAPLLLTALYSFVPPVSTLMLARWATLRPVARAWVPLTEINPVLPRAVIASEDAYFCSHRGVDWGAVREVMNDKDGPSRGASTISMQVAKNLFLWQGFGYVRKPIEIVLAHWIELVWSKDRIMEVYLNVVEWGPDGVFGAEESARRAFRKSADALSAQDAAILVAALPNPVVRNPARPGPRLKRRAGRLVPRDADTSCLSPR